MEHIIRIKRRPALLMIGFLLTHALVIKALPEDKKQPLHLFADGVMVDYLKGMTELDGHARITQGTTILLGDKMVIYTDDHQELIKVIAYGDQQHPASYQTLPLPTEAVFSASADRITYIRAEELALFEGNAHARSGLNQFDGPEFEYHTDQQKVVTRKTPNQHSSIIIYPETKK